MATGLQFTFTVEHLMSSTFVVTAFSGEDILSTPFDLSIQLASRMDVITPDDVVDKSAVLTVWQDGELQQSWQGIVSRFIQSDVGHHHTFYEVSLVPPLARLSLRQNSRIFQQQSAPDIIATVLQEMDIVDYAFALIRQYPQREYCVQYRESDLAFIQRIAAEEGIFFHFDHSAQKNTVIFSDDCQNLAVLPTALPYNALAGGATKEKHVRHLTRHTQLRPSSATLQDRTFKNPAYRFMHCEHSKNTSYQRDIYDHYDYGVFHGDDNNTVSFTKIRLEALRSDAEQIEMISNVAPLLAGLKFELRDHNEPACNRDWTVVSVLHEGEQPQALEEMGGEGITRYHNRVKAIQGDKLWRPLPLVKPRVDGVSVATVVGPEGEEIYCDEFGRVKVSFPWDKYHGQDDKASCWIRVSQAWAGGQYGSMMLPRVGHEVLVSYVEGDIDRPIITGCTYNAVQKPPFALPDYKTRTVLRSNTHQGEGYNELYFEDQKGEEEIHVRAQKNLSIDVLNSKHEAITFNSIRKVGNDDAQAIAKNQTITIDGQQDIAVKGNQIIKIDADKHGTVVGDWIEKVSGTVGIQADEAIVLKSASRISFQVGGSFISIHSGGVDIQGVKINLNSGGSVSDIPVPAQPAILKNAAQDGSPFVSNCQKVDGNE
ncbi:type VI secretion system Vgr family protein [Photobacterium damselae]|uniref:type VI secretion system Vgr family protein n=1 Tax=Photobacterium damselae TaxID=38293 RepID=UPI002542C926